MYLPDELWPQIAYHLEVRDLWLSFRKVDRQLSRCAEEEFTTRVPPANCYVFIKCDYHSRKGTRRIRIETRRPIVRLTPGLRSSQSQDAELPLLIVDVQPSQYRERFFERWKAMQQEHE
jgi:hypothetical protein